MITELPETMIQATLEHYGLGAVLTGYISRKEITKRASWREFEMFVKSQGYEIVTEPGNIYGRVGVRQATIKATPVMRMVTRSDVAAVYGSGR